MSAYGNLFQGQQNFTWTPAHHVFKLGAEARLNRDTTNFGISPIEHVMCKDQKLNRRAFVPQGLPNFSVLSAHLLTGNRPVPYPPRL
jgi:hypothetical protein